MFLCRSEPVTSIVGEPEMFINKGSTMNLTCVVRHSPEPPTAIYWTHDHKVPASSDACRLLYAYCAAIIAEGGQKEVKVGRAGTRLLITISRGTRADGHALIPDRNGGITVVFHAVTGVSEFHPRGKYRYQRSINDNSI